MEWLKLAVLDSVSYKVSVKMSARAEVSEVWGRRIHFSVPHMAWHGGLAMGRRPQFLSMWPPEDCLSVLTTR